MIAVKGYFDGEKVHLLESVPVPVQPSEVTVWFSEDAAQKKAKSTQARKKLRGSAKGLRLWEKLVAGRQSEYEENRSNRKYKQNARNDTL